MKKRTYIKIGMLVILLAVLTITSNVVENKNTIQTSAGVNLDNKKVEWGIRRSDNHEQPDLGSKNKKLIDENEDMAIGNNEEKYVYLTFDEGYEAGYTPKILQVLKENNVNATFFLTAHFVNTQENLVKEMIDNGHIIGNHF